MSRYDERACYRVLSGTTGGSAAIDVGFGDREVPACSFLALSSCRGRVEADKATAGLALT